MTIENNAKFVDFQAEYEGSLYFTRSNVFRALARAPDFVPTNSDAPFQGAGATSSSDISHQSGEGELNCRLHCAAVDSIRIAVRQPSLSRLSGVFPASGECSGAAFSNPCAQ